MPNPFEDSTSLFPDITQAVNEAYDENAANGDATDTAEVKTPNLDDVSEEGLKAAKEQGVTSSGLEVIPNFETANSFNEEFVKTEELFKKIGLTPPTPEEFTSAGVDFVALAARYEEMIASDMTPRIVISPSLPLVDDQSDFNWKKIFGILAADESMKTGGVHVYSEASKVSATILKNEMAVMNSAPSVIDGSPIHSARSKNSSETPKWTIVIIDCGDQPEHLGRSHSDLVGPIDPRPRRLTSVSQYLTLQARTIQSGQDPIGSFTKTWLGAPLGHGFSRRGLVGYYSQKENKICIDVRGSTTKFDDTGTRPPVWG